MDEIEISEESFLDARLSALDRAISLHTEGHYSGDILETAEQLYWFLIKPIAFARLQEAINAEEQDEDDEEDEASEGGLN